MIYVRDPAVDSDDEFTGYPGTSPSLAVSLFRESRKLPKTHSVQVMDEDGKSTMFPKPRGQKDAKPPRKKRPGKQPENIAKIKKILEGKRLTAPDILRERYGEQNLPMIRDAIRFWADIFAACRKGKIGKTKDEYHLIENEK